MMQKNSKSEILHFDVPLFETHCHLDYLKRLSWEEQKKLCLSNQVTDIMTISVSPSNQRQALEQAKSKTDQKDLRIYCSQGIHPHHAKDYTDEVEVMIKSNLFDPLVRAVGEIGLDYYYDHSPRDIQRKVFERQLQLAVDHQKSIIIHSRDAEEDTIDLLKNFSSSIKNCVIHSFSSKKNLAEFALSQDFYLGFNGMMTFKKADSIREIVSFTPIERIVLETDAPFLTPDPHRGIENAAHLVSFVAKKLLEIKKTEPHETLQRIYSNSLNLFRIGP